jgi:NAD(P)-dependent dehydrogenase (short-subunit alcohol dehydrogenase family)
MHVKDKVCVVTGAASGIGEAVARASAQAGARGVVVADLKSSRDWLASVAADIDGLAVTADVAQEGEIQSLIAAAEERFGPVDVFFSNAGRSRKGAYHRAARSLSSGAHSRDPLAPTGWRAMTVYLPSALGANGASRPE